MADSTEKPTPDQKERRRGRPRTGTIVRTRDGRLQAIVTMADGKRKRLPPFPRGMSEAMAREKVAVRAEQASERDSETRSGAPKGSVTEWFGRFAAHREARGLTSVPDDRSRFANHVAGALGPLEMANVSRADVEGLVRELDAKVQTDALSWKTAQNVWMLVSKMFREAVRSKSVALRVRTDNPCTDVAAPDRGARKAKAYIYPSELLTFLACPDVPLRWRRMVAVSVYLGLRAGELDALEWEDIDLEHGIVNVHRALDRSRPGMVKATKTGTARRFRIEPNLVPLLRLMREEARGGAETAQGPVFPRLKLTGRSEKLRMFLRRAKVNRPELHANAADRTRKPLGWHDLRASCATWLAVRGEEPLKIMQRLGHRNFNTTMLYVREAEQLREGFGEAFSPLPAAMLQSAPTALGASNIDRISITEDLSLRNHRAGHGTRRLSVGPEPQDTSGDSYSPPPPRVLDAEGKSANPRPAIEKAIESPAASEAASDPVETALADALTRAATAGAWDAVSQLTTELKARREARAQVVSLDAERLRRGKR